jgi:hypothetical protein
MGRPNPHKICGALSPALAKKILGVPRDPLIGPHVYLGPLVIPVGGRINLLEFRECARKFAKGPLKSDFESTDVHGFNFDALFGSSLAQTRMIASLTSSIARQSSRL